MATGKEIVRISRYMGETDHEAKCFTIEVKIPSMEPPGGITGLPGNPESSLWRHFHPPRVGGSRRL